MYMPFSVKQVTEEQSNTFYIKFIILPFIALMLLGTVLFSVNSTSTPTGQVKGASDTNSSEDTPSEIEILQKQNLELQRENELLRRENEQLKNAGQ